MGQKVSVPSIRFWLAWRHLFPPLGIVGPVHWHRTCPRFVCTLDVAEVASVRVVVLWLCLGLAVPCWCPCWYSLCLCHCSLLALRRHLFAIAFRLLLADVAVPAVDMLCLTVARWSSMLDVVGCMVLEVEAFLVVAFALVAFAPVEPGALLEMGASLEVVDLLSSLCTVAVFCLACRPGGLLVVR